MSAQTMNSALNVNRERLVASLEALGKIGSYRDEATALLGVNRLALSAADGEGRRHVVALMKEAGLQVSIDAIGNVYGRRAGMEDGLAPVMAGSHVDSVPTAGIFDGCLGCLGALEAVRTLNDRAIVTRRPIVVAFFTEEEGCRFGTDMLGSAVATGRIPLEQAYALRDRSGAAVLGELEQIGFKGSGGIPLKPPHAYLECHIEQGPILRSKGIDLGVVLGVQAISWFELTITGKSAHAGSTPMHLRADAGVAASRINLKLREMISSGEYGEHMRATMGAIVPHPGLVNIVPGKVIAMVDLRNPDDGLMQRAETDLLAFYKEVSRAENVEIAARQTARTQFVPFDPSIQGKIAAAAAALGLKHEPIISGAGHDAQEMARICRAGMIFVPGEYDGISHNPREYSTPDQCANGVNVLLDVLLSLAGEGGAP